MSKNILWIGIGGGLGSIARYLCHRWITTYYPHPFPWGTFAINFTGCFLIGIFWGIFQSHENESWKLFLLAGLCGGFTTFSAFTLESMELLRQQRTGLFFAYLTGSIILCLLATYIGMKISCGIQTGKDDL